MIAISEGFVPPLGLWRVQLDVRMSLEPEPWRKVVESALQLTLSRLKLRSSFSQSETLS